MPGRGSPIDILRRCARLHPAFCGCDGDSGGSDNERRMGPVSTWRSALTTRSRDEITVVLRDLLEEVVGAPPGDVTLESSLRDDLGADSLQLLDLAVMCERRLGVQISE